MIGTATHYYVKHGETDASAYVRNRPCPYQGGRTRPLRHLRDTSCSSKPLYVSYVH